MWANAKNAGTFKFIKLNFPMERPASMGYAFDCFLLLLLSWLYLLSWQFFVLLKKADGKLENITSKNNGTLEALEYFWHWSNCGSCCLSISCCTSITSIRAVLFIKIYMLLHLLVGWFRSGKNILRIDVIGCKYVPPVTFIRVVVFVHIYILLRLFVGWFSIKFISHYVYSWGGFVITKSRM